MHAGLSYATSDTGLKNIFLVWYQLEQESCTTAWHFDEFMFWDVSAFKNYGMAFEANIKYLNMTLIN